MAGQGGTGGDGFDPRTAASGGFFAHLSATLSHHLGGAEAARAVAFIGPAADRVFALQDRSSALYHTAEHTMLAVLAGLDMLRGRAEGGSVPPADWLHGVLALMMHDVGYCRGACAGDAGRVVVAGPAGEVLALGRAATDASLGPIHVARSMIHARESLAGRAPADPGRVAAAIAATRFPSDANQDPVEPGSEADLVRAADLIGQFGDRRYLEKAPALFHEMAETGLATRLGYGCPADLVAGFADFYAGEIAPLVGTGAALLSRTRAGRGWLLGIERNIARSRVAGRLI